MSHCIAVTMAMVSGLLFGSLRFSIFAITSKQVHVSKLQTYLCVIQIQTVLSTDLMGSHLTTQEATVFLLKMPTLKMWLKDPV